MNREQREKWKNDCYYISNAFHNLAGELLSGTLDIPRLELTFNSARAAVGDLWNPLQKGIIDILREKS